MSTDTSAASAAFERLAEVASLRADMYHLLSIGFLYPTRELAEGLIDGGFAADLTETTKRLIETLSLSDATAAALYAPADELVTVDFGTDSESLYHALAVEYTRLFIGAPSPVVSPYESIHVDSEPDSPALLMVSPSAVAVQRAYREVGVDMRSSAEPPDHIATELEFSYYLCCKEAFSWSEGDDAGAKEWRRLESVFATEHLAAWGIEFARQVQEATSQKFCAALSLLAQAYLRLEGEAKS